MNEMNENFDEFDKYVKNPDIEILRNDTEIQAVREKNTNMLGIVYRKATKLNDIEVSAPCILMCKELPDGLRVCVSDPSQLLEELTITFDGNYSLETEDMLNINAKNEGNKMAVSVNTEESFGSTFSFALKNK